MIWGYPHFRNPPYLEILKHPKLLAWTKKLMKYLELLKYHTVVREIRTETLKNKWTPTISRCESVCLTGSASDWNIYRKTQ